MSEPIIIPPALADAVIENICTGLKSKLSWLDESFGRAERIVKQIDGRDYYLPAVHIGGGRNPNEYIELSPDSQIGNFSFFWMLDPQNVIWRPRIQGNFRDPFALIFWFDLRKVYDELDNRNIMNLESEVLKALNEIMLPNGHITVSKVYHLPENIYREFSLKNVDNQFLMHPYAGFRIEGELYYEQPC